MHSARKIPLVGSSGTQVCVTRAQLNSPMTSHPHTSTYAPHMPPPPIPGLKRHTDLHDASPENPASLLASRSQEVELVGLAAKIELDELGRSFS